jgi:pyrroloquinoline quinone (PQQ) biosynthesis protein C
LRKHGWFGLERHRWGKLFKISDDKLDFFELHEEADIEHSDAGWNAVAKFARKLHMEDEVVEACRKNLMVWELYLNGIGAAGDRLKG